MDAQYWLGLILTTLSILALVASTVKWYIGIQVKPVLEAVEDIRKETKTNGGSSMRDEIRQIKSEQEHAREKRKETKDKLDHMYDLLIEYIASNKR